MNTHNTNNIVVQHSRRTLLKGVVVLTGIIASGSLIAALTPSQSWALEATKLNATQAQDLLNMAKVLYPHEGLEDAVYALLVKDIDQACQEPETYQLIQEGLKALSTPHAFSQLPFERQHEKIVAIEGTPFFERVRHQCLTSLYDNTLASAHFGYEGESWSKGGYLLRGFDDLTWLPNPTLEASPAYK